MKKLWLILAIFMITALTAVAQPTFNSDLKDQTVSVGADLKIDIIDQDADNGSLVLSESPDLDFVTFSGDEIRIKPTTGDEGTYDITVNASDDNSTVTKDIKITVTSFQYLQITDIDVTCDDCDDDKLDKTGGKIEDLEINEEFEIRIEVSNLWPEDTDDHDIENIDIEAELERIGDRSKQIERAREFDLEPDEEEDVTFSFEVPNEADEDREYDLEIRMEGTDEDGTRYEETIFIQIEVTKEDHDVEITRATIRPDIVSCDRTVEVDIEVQNIGATNEDDIEINIEQKRLDIAVVDFIDDLDADDLDDPDTLEQRSYNINIPRDAEPGRYTIPIEIFYDRDRFTDKQVVEVTVEECGPVSPPEEEEEEEEPEEEVEVVEAPPTTTTPPKPVDDTEVDQDVQDDEDVESGKATGVKTGYIVLLLVIVVILLGVAGYLVYLLVRK